MVGTGLRRLVLGLAGLGAALALGGCVDNLPVAAVGKGDIRDAIAKGELTSPRAATVALVSLEGAPDGVASAFRLALNAEAAHREITLTDPASAHYLLRGYLSAYAGPQGVTIAYTYDVFDAGDKRRQQRVADTLIVPAAGETPWNAVDTTIVTSLAGHSADDLAIVLPARPKLGPVSSPRPALPPYLSTEPRRRYRRRDRSHADVSVTPCRAFPRFRTFPPAHSRA